MTQDELQVVISAEIKPLQRELAKVKKELNSVDNATSNMSKSMESGFSSIGKTIDATRVKLAAMGVAVGTVVAQVGKLGVESIELDSQTASLDKTMGRNKNTFLTWGEQVASSFGISKKAAIQYGSQFSRMVARYETDTGAVTDSTVELLQISALAAAANPQFSVEETMGRIRSGLSGRNEAIEDLGIEVTPAAIQSTTAYANAVDRLGVAWADMNSQQQAQVRTQAIVEQGMRLFGDQLPPQMVQLAALRANLQNLRTAWGDAFAPIVQVVLPLLNVLVSALTVVANAVGSFISKILGLFGIVTDKGKDSIKQTNKLKSSAGGISAPMNTAADGAGKIGRNLGKATKEAKELKRQLFGFDVIHNVEEPDSSLGTGSGAMPGGGGGGGGIDIPDFGAGFDLEDVDSKWKKQLDGLNQKASDAVKRIGETLKGLALMIGTLGTIAAPWIFTDSFWSAMANSPYAFIRALSGVGTALDYFTGMITYFMTDMGVTFFGKMNGILSYLPTFGGAFKGFFSKLLTGSMPSILWSFPKLLIDIVGASFGVLGKAQLGIIAGFTSAIVSLKDLAMIFVGTGTEMISTIWLFTSETIASQGLLAGIFEGFKAALTIIGEMFAPILTSTGAIIALIAAVGVAVYQLWDESEEFRSGWMAVWDSVTNVVDNFMSTFFMPVVGIFKDALNSIVENGLKPLWEGFKSMVEKVGNALSEMLVAAEPVVNFFIDYFGPQIEMIINLVVKAFTFLANSIGKTMGKIFDNIGDIIAGIINVFTGIINFLTGVFTGDWAKAWDGVKQIFSGMWNSLTGIVKLVWNTIIGMFKAGGSIFLGIGTGILETFTKVVNAMIKGINSVIAIPFNALNGVLSSIRDVSIMGAKPFGWVPKISVPAIPAFATGGFPEDGLFFANSNELVGKFTNGKTAVANNEQIVAGVSQGVAQAVSQVLAGSSNSSNQPINLTVQIGSKTIAKETIDAVDEYTRRTGISFKTV